MFERPQGGERAVLVHVDLPAEADRESLQEFRELVVSAGAEPVTTVTASRSAPHPRYFVGIGKAEEIRAAVREAGADIVLFNHALTPVQERNLEKLFQCQVLDRTGLILDIFAQRARTHEGKLQVELAQLRHLSTRLVRGWTHLERQKGGIGLRGPGETQLETDRRLIGQRIRQLKERLRHVDSRRTMNRRNRVRADIPTVALVGYTNAGKSTLFNALTEAGVYVEDKLFATLDPTLRRLALADGSEVVLADTVGFVHDLPHELIAAFRSTLQEAREADLILHLIDASDPNRWQRVRQVNAVLKELDAERVPQIRVYNKIDKLDRPAKVTNNRAGEGRAVWLSAVTGEGTPLLVDAVAGRLCRPKIHCMVRLGARQGRQRALLFDMGAVLQESPAEDGGWLLELELAKRDFQRFLKREHLSPDILQDPQSDETAVLAI